MPLKTTVIGAWPKPDYFQLPDWFDPKLNGMSHGTADVGRARSRVLGEVGEQVAEEQLEKAVKDVLDIQESLGIDVVTDGEMARETYYLHLCRNLSGVDFENTVDKVMREGAYITEVPTITGKIAIKDEAELCKEWKRAQALTDKPVKYTFPGPMTILDGMIDTFYGSDQRQELVDDLVACINTGMRALQAAGCKVLQLDEPVMMRFPDAAMDYGIDNVARCFEGISAEVTTAVHLCCGYPEHIDDDDYLKADKERYRTLASKLDQTGVNQVSIEDAEACNDLSLLAEFKTATVILGSVTAARSTVETVDEIKKRVSEALQHIPAERLVLAPDCGLGFLTSELAQAKLANMVAAAKAF